MRRRMRRRGVVPFTFAALLTVAAGLSLAEEHAWAPAVVPEGSAASSDLSGSDLSGRSAKGVMPDKAVSDPHPGSAGGHTHEAATSKPGVGSRALTGHDDQEPATDEPPNTDPQYRP